MTFLRYFMPLILHGNKRGIRSKIFYERSLKYCAVEPHLDKLIKLSKEYKFDIYSCDEINKHECPITFLVDASGFDHIKYNTKNIVLTSMVDYRDHYKNYISKVKNVIFPSEYMAKLHNCESPKNLYLGSPKYDVNFNSDSIVRKYQLDPKKRNAFVILPKTRDTHIFANSFSRLYNCLHDLGYSIITKTRGKDAYGSFLGDFHFMDHSWFPHDSMELMHASDIIINFSSTSIKECILLNKPLIDFNVKPFGRFLNDLYKHGYCINLSVDFEPSKLKDSILKLTDSDLSAEYQKAKDLYLFEPGNVSESILEKCL